MAKNIGVLLSGCGVYDGTEIHEAVLTLLFLDRAGARIVCVAPDKAQYHVIDHLNQQETGQQRNVLAESARIARGEIRSLKTVAASDLDALIIPGGFGAAKNLSDFAFKGQEAQVDADVRRLIRDMATAKKPIGAICIAPAVLAKALADRHPVVTIGNDVDTARAIEAMGGVHQDRAVDEICVDEANRLVTAPAYMLGPGIKDVARGIEQLVARVMEMVRG
jgi:enhancing lycopene biosynthesis protein 2